MAYIAPPTWAYFEQASVYKTLSEQHGHVCGLPMLAIITLACVAAAVLAAIALLLSVSSFRALPPPRSKLRAAEIGAVSAPLVLPFALVALLLIY